ncbi:YfbK domain-containing protein [Archangium lansingense]|uniref:von Willebrand factor type A domain-containing protein n=1 Tax=Archangium lansingense TaxID=2995310 RepID=A0ABT4A5F8_9BACT|nr:von Willebrand factor type A domain-containing protein [Archangium lansinium]MCY1076868.1 von Willebrand factor type A domain-containing protein [Archangium lansinium]
MKHVLRSALCCVLLLLSAPALADSVIIGTVSSAETKKPIPDVVVTANSPNLQGEQVAVTDAQGNYRIPQLPPGVYTLRFYREMYRPFARADIKLPLDRTIRVNVELLPESFSEEIVVTGGSPPLLDFGAIGRGISDFFGGRRNSNPPPPPSTPPSTSASPAAPPTERTTSLPQQPFSDMYFKSYGVNPTIDTEEERFSTFSVDVDRASYALARGYLERGAMPDEQAVRVEEFVNSFDYGYRSDPESPFSVHVEGFPSPNRKGYHVVHIGLKAREVSRQQRKPTHLVFVIDVSGSMNIENRLGLVKQALRLLVNELDERDRVSIAVYGSTAHLVIGPTSAAEKHKLMEAIDEFYSDGSTNAQAGIELGYSIASEHVLKGGINRVILCSDGVANNGITDADGIWERVRAQAAKGITLTTIGFGMGNYNDVLMERLAQVGEGNYAYVDQLEEARRIFVQNLTGTLQVVAKDVKLQLEFDRKAVARYRLVGYENRMLTKEQFADDRVDAGEVGAGHSVTAIYEVKLREPTDTFAALRIRYKEPEGGDSRELEKQLPSSVLRPAYGRTAPPTRLSYVAAAFAEKLRGSYWIRTLSWEQLHALWEALDEPLRDRPDVKELGALIRKAQGLDRRTDRFEQLTPVVSMDFDRVPVIK